ncbi:hypothetical protein F1737_09730 [Methanoplanus sp. FWC-SCC4]|uniref:HNH nuclease domain-containing protein n=1 Tax=Methanochimaera problematica TaxID=2609417 RepID=A0AA97FCH0_9EURY|nr:HNH endonuclease domain-containing protein [Methanoplanus sp. FWC-SCC4]WOF16945.1 hypothetical protein F1737_09730 [Methanoplanus sp. FWC-SCC4]
MDFSELKKINSIIEHDKADTTYKYALIRSVIEVCQKHQVLGETKDNKVTFPLGILIEKWILYYYPLTESEIYIPQKKGEPDGKHSIVFRPLFEKLTGYYKDKGGFSVFYQDYTCGNLPLEIQPVFYKLSKEIRNTIINQPMQYLGRSYNGEFYSIFTPKRPVPKIIFQEINDRSLFVRSGGYFSMSADLATIFEYFGSFISGEEGLLKKWAEFTTNLDKTGQISDSVVLEILNRSPETQRSVYDVRKCYESQYLAGNFLECVWSGKRISNPEMMAIDHMLPFSVWKNNDLWNLLPSLASVNSKKSDSIPAPALVEKRSDSITGYWDILHERFPARFEKEIGVSLLKKPGPGWQDDAIVVLAGTCEYLINVRGFSEWSSV